MVMWEGEGIVFNMGVILFGWRVIFLVCIFYKLGFVLRIVFMLFRKLGIFVFVLIFVFVNII